MTLGHSTQENQLKEQYQALETPFEMDFTVKQNDSYSDSINLYILDHSWLHHLHLSSQALQIIKVHCWQPFYTTFCTQVYNVQYLVKVLID